MIRRDAGLRAALRAFTLLEVMAALFVFLVGVVGILALFTAALALHRDATQRTIVAVASEEVRARVLEALEGIPDPSAPLPKFTDEPIAGRRGYFFSAELKLDPERGVEGGVAASVHVYALDAGRKRGETFTLFVRPGADPERWIREARGERPKPASGPPKGPGQDDKELR